MVLGKNGEITISQNEIKYNGAVLVTLEKIKYKSCCEILTF